MSKTIYDYVLKFIIVGDSTVGKSNIMSKYTDKRFLSNHDMTIGVEFATKIVSISNTLQNNLLDEPHSDNSLRRANTNYKIQIWDTAGQETFKAITRSYYRGTIGCLLVYDITRRESFDSINMWLSELRKFSDPNTVIALVGNKIDLEKSRVISYNEGNTYAEQNNLIFFETSAKTSQNIEACFTHIVQVIQKKIENSEIIVLGTTNVSTIKLLPKPDDESSYWGCAC
jgi:Ras-related protein Rab-2A